MKPLSEFKNQDIQVVFTDIDDTLTVDGRLIAPSYQALWDLSKAGIKVVPVTGRPAGWCELIARLWPVAGVVGENGGFYYAYKNKKMIRHYLVDADQRKVNRTKLDVIRDEVLLQVPGSAVASDQFCRELDLAIDFCEDVPALSKSEVQKVVDIFVKAGAVAKVSSIHVNGWFGEYDKLTMCKQFSKRELGIQVEQEQKHIAFVGDSPNDEPMFDFFENSFAVSNINNFKDELVSPPKFVAKREGGFGFQEISQLFL